MKKQLIIFFLMTICCINAFSQQKIYIYLTDGQVITKDISEIDSISFTAPSTPSVAKTAIDLGLSVKWANLNVGATSEEESGYLVGWGDPAGSLTSIDLQYYPVLNPVWGITKSQYDIAHVTWGGDWRMPTNEEIQELIDNCTWTWVSEDGKTGFTVTAKDGSASIFLPATGYRKGTEESGSNEGHYWSGSLSSSDDQKAEALSFDSSNSTGSVNEYERYYGFAIRPVQGSLENGVKVVTGYSTPLSSQATVDVNVYGALSDVDVLGVAYATDKSNLDVNGDSIVSTSIGFSNGSYSFVLSNLKSNTNYYYVAYAKYDGDVVVGDTLSFTTSNKFPVPTEPVDLGLSVKWSPWNIGAESEADYGSLIAWGDPTGESVSFNPADFACGYTISDIAATEYDVAHVQWGDKWRLPSSAELEELASLNWTYKYDYQSSGVNGWLVSASNGNSIFIPRGGFENAEGIRNQGQSAFYWTSEYGGEGWPNSATGCNVLANNITSKTYDKILRMSIRPVYGDVSGDPVDPNATKVVDGHDAINMGFKIRWASCNIGASKPSDTGNFYSWAETSEKSTYSRDEYTYYEDGSYIIPANDISGDSIYDVATATWGSKWRMPTITEMDNLCSYCTKEWTSQNGVYGYKFTSKETGNSIFLPVAGFMTTSNLSHSSSGYYWTSTSGESRFPNEGLSWYLTFSSSTSPTTTYDYRYKGMLVRPVTDE